MHYGCIFLCFCYSKVSCSVIECAIVLSVCLRLDGGVSSNNFVMQLTADLFGRKVARPQHCEMSCLGAAFVAGLGVGMQAHAHTQHVHYAVFFKGETFAFLHFF